MLHILHFLPDDGSAESKLALRLGKAIFGQALRVTGGWGSQNSRQSTCASGKAVNYTHRTPRPQWSQKDYVNGNSQRHYRELKFASIRPPSAPPNMQQGEKYLRFLSTAYYVLLFGAVLGRGLSLKIEWLRHKFKHKFKRELKERRWEQQYNSLRWNDDDTRQLPFFPLLRHFHFQSLSTYLTYPTVTTNRTVHKEPCSI